MGMTDANSVMVRVERNHIAGRRLVEFGRQRNGNLLSPVMSKLMHTASAIGDDRLQRQSQGYVVPDAFTHGSSEQRTRWFMTGLKPGNVASCDTFRAEPL